MDLDAEARALAKQRARDTGATRTMEIECKKCRRVTTHEVGDTDEDGVALAACLRCRELDAEAAKLVEARQREQEIIQRANAAGGAAVAAGAPKVAKRSEGSMIAIGGGAAAAVGSFLPWITAFGGVVSKSGIDGSDGWITLGAGATVAITGLTNDGKKGIRVLWTVLGLVCLAVVGLDYLDIQQRIEAVGAGLEHGVGLYLAGIGSLCMAISGLVKPKT